MKDQIFDATSIKVNPLDGYVVTVKGEPLHILGDVKVMKQKTTYFAAGWFSAAQKEAYDEAMKAMNDNPTLDLDRSYVPLEHQYKDIRVDEHPEYLKSKTWARATYAGDILGIKQNDITTVVYIPSEEDVGCGVEVGIAHALGKPVIIIIPDKFYGNPINLMTWGAADNIIKMSDLATFDFNNISFDFYNGSVY